MKHKSPVILALNSHQIAFGVVTRLSRDYYSIAIIVLILFVYRWLILLSDVIARAPRFTNVITPKIHNQ